MVYADGGVGAVVVGAGPGAGACRLRLFVVLPLGVVVVLLEDGFLGYGWGAGRIHCACEVCDEVLGLGIGLSGQKYKCICPRMNSFCGYLSVHGRDEN